MTTDTIVTECAARLGTSATALRSSSRLPDLCRARDITALVLRMAHFSYPQIAKALAHSSPGIIVAIRRATQSPEACAKATAIVGMLALGPSLKAVRAGEPIPMACVGGVIRRPAETDGLYVDAGADMPPLFLSRAVVEAALAELREGSA